jgi:lipoprotein LpqH
VLYEFLTGRAPFVGDTHERLIAARLYEPPPTPSLAVDDVPQARAALSAPVQDAAPTRYAVPATSFGVQDAVPAYQAPPPPSTYWSPPPNQGSSRTALRVTVDGRDVDVAGSVTCATIGGGINIAMGNGTTGIVLADGDPPTVISIGLDNVNGVTLAVGQGTGSATVQKSGNIYTITGTATGVDMANAMQPVTKPFEIQATCP